MLRNQYQYQWMSLHCTVCHHHNISNIDIKISKNTFTIHLHIPKPMNTHVLNRDGECTKALSSQQIEEIVLGEVAMEGRGLR